MANLSDRNGKVKAVETPQSPGKAGEIKQYGGASAPSGYLECSGQAVSRTDFSQLFTNIGTKYGVGDGSTTFNLPDGPRSTVEFPINVSHTSWTLEIASGYVYQDYLGQYRLAFNFLFDRGSEGGFTNTIFTINGVTFKDGFVQGQPITAWVCGTDNSNSRQSANAAALNNQSNIRLNNSASAVRYVGCSGDVILESKPSDTLMSLSSFSTFDEALESIPVIKLYDDSTEGATVGVAEATVDTAGTAKLPNGTLRLDTGNGHGSTNNKIRRFSNITEQSGDAFTYVDSATDGMSITVNRDMVASFSYSGRYNTSTGQHGITVNATGTTDIFSVPAANKLTIAYASSGHYGNVSVSVKLSKGDIIRAHDAGNNDNSTNNVQFVAQELYRLGD